METLDHADKAAEAAENTAPIQRGRPFEPGKSGNPKGRPKGSRNHATILAEALMDGEAEALTRKVIEMAKGGDSTALQLCLERLLPPRRGRSVTFEVPAKIETAADAMVASSLVIKACADGVLTPGDAAEIVDVIAKHVQLIETTDLEERVKAMEAELKSKMAVDERSGQK